jgi:hypothetical protein
MISDRPNETAKKTQNLDSTFKVNPLQLHGFGVQAKSAESTPATKAQLWESYQQAKQLNHNSAKLLPVQAKLTILQRKGSANGQPGDKYEQEADNIADRVMAMSEPAQIQREELPEEEEELQMKPLAGTISPLVQREELPEEEEEELQMKSLDNSIQREDLPEEEEEIQMKEAATSNTPAATTSLEDRLSSSKGGGSPLSDDVRSFMEPRFGADFSGVRVHTGSDAVQMNQDVNAQAFAHGSDVYFGAGKAPGKDALTAHELTHVVQQVNTIQRYDAYEHAQAGDRAKGGGTITVQGIDVTAGEINALADLYASPEDLRKAEPNELKQLVGLIRKQKVDPNSVSEADWDKATNGRYTQLNLKNSKHFSPSNPALIAPQSSVPSGSDNRSMWKGYHKQAILKANQFANASHPNQRAELLEEAKLTNFFGEHYLTDAFSAGHLFNKDDTLAAIQENLPQQEKQLSTIFKSISAKVWATQSNFISKYEAKKYWRWWNLNTADRLQGLLEGIYDTPKGKEAVQSAIVKAAHDQLNTQKNDNGFVGVPVTNDFEEWVLSGDRTLDTSPITQKWLNKALEQSRTNIQEATQAKVSTEPDRAIKKVLDCLPRPTNNSEKAIHDLLQKVTNPTGGMVDAIANVLSREIEATFQAVEDEGFIRKKKGK